MGGKAIEDRNQIGPRREVVKEFYNIGMRGKKLQDKVTEKLGILVSKDEMQRDITYLSKKGELDKDSDKRKKEEIIKKFYNLGLERKKSL